MRNHAAVHPIPSIQNFWKGAENLFIKKVFRKSLTVMFLHIGNNRNIREKEIIGIFDADTATMSAVTKKFLSSAQKKGAVEFSSEEIPKSFLLYCHEGEQRICFSQLSVAALVGRSEKSENN